MSILDWLRAPERADSPESDVATVRRIARELRELEPEQLAPGEPAPANDRASQSHAGAP